MRSTAHAGTPSLQVAKRIRGLGRGTLSFLRIMARNKVGFAGFLGLLFFLVLGFIVPHFVPISTTTNINDISLAPSWQHVLGTDSEGRDVLKQIIHGGSDVMIIGFLTAALTTLIAVSLGALSAFVGGWFDTLMTGLADIVLTIPQFPLLAVLATLITLSNIFYVALLIAFLGWPFLFRSIRAQVLSLKERDYVEAARCLDLSVFHILFRELLPNMLPFIAISFVFAATGAIYYESGLFFLGLIPLAGNNWGVMIYLSWTRGAAYDPSTMWYILSPVLAIALFQLTLVFMSRSLEDLFNPRLRQGV
jgi:peptide/nickel transport system permease protein